MVIISTVQTLVDRLRSQKHPAIEDTECLYNALSTAIGSYRLSIISYLMDQGVKLHPNMYVPALRKLDTNNAIAMFQIFLDHGWDINSKTDLGFTVLK